MIAAIFIVGPGTWYERRQPHSEVESIALAMAAAQPVRVEVDIPGQPERRDPTLDVRQESDVIGYALTAGFTDLVAADVGQRVSVLLPHGYEVAYTVVSIRRELKSSHLTLVTDRGGLVGTITVSDQTAYGTLASRWGSYSVEESGGQGYFVDHASLNLRMNYHEKDYRVPRLDRPTAS